MNTVEEKKIQKISGLQRLKEFLYIVVNTVINVYLFFMIAVMPFYYEEGYSHIGTDKSVFFRKYSVKIGKILFLVWILYLFCSFLLFIKESNQWSEKYQKWKSDFAIKKLSITDCFIFFYAVSVILSYACSNYKEQALWGVNRWYMGMIPQLILVMVYFFVAKVWKRQRFFAALFFPVSAVVFGLGYLNRFGIYPFDMGSTNPQFISTIGNINWYCGYLVSVFFGGFFLFWRAEQLKLWQKILLEGYLWIGFATLVTHGSSSGIFTLIVMLVVCFCLSASDVKKMKRFWQEILLLSLVCLFTFFMRKSSFLEITYIETTTELFTNSFLPFVILGVTIFFYMGIETAQKRGGIFEERWKKIQKILGKVVGIGAAGALLLFVFLTAVNTLLPQGLAFLEGSSLFTFSPQWGSNRGATWSAGVRCFAEQDILHKLIGVGPDCMSAFLYKDASSGLQNMVNEVFPSLSLANAHNEWITILVNMGVLGFVSYIGIMVTAIWRFIRLGKESYITGACGFCVLAYTINNMFSFQQSMSAVTIFIILGIGERWSRK